MKQSGLARVAALYGQVERVRLVALQQAAIAVNDAALTRDLATAAGVLRRLEGRAALALGEAEGWRLAESTSEAAEVMAESAEELRLQRESLRAEAGEDYLASRVQRKRVGRIVECVALAEKGIQDRREQAEADDRFAARMCWSRMKTS